VPIATVALVGYTNAGKSTLFNALTRAGVLESAKMFATLDPTIRAVVLPSRRKVLLSDTVGFIRNLPHTLVTSFRATLEDVQRAALLLHVSDATSPVAGEQEEQVEEVLRELDAHAKPRLRVVNKIDRLLAREREALTNDEQTIHVSASKGTGLTALLERIDAAMELDPVTSVHLRIPQSEGRALALLEAEARVYAREYQDGVVDLQAQAPKSVVERVRRFVVD
jgi:GTP-binding protein HflX